MRDGIIDPYMRTNLSRFTVAFSDLSWESVLGEHVPDFPQAWQVGQYLSAYATKYLDDQHLRLGRRVVRTVRTREPAAKWRVSWVEERRSDESVVGPATSDAEVTTEDFDLLVVASGYFARPFIPEIPGLRDFSGVLHSSALQKGNGITGKGPDTHRGNVVVIGGSMSGVEAASTIALRHSSALLATGLNPQSANIKVHHIHSRPFWNLPTYIPHETTNGVSFLPLDLAMYDLSRRPPGPIDYTVGPVPKDKVAKSKDYFRSLLGTEYEKIGYLDQPNTSDDSSLPPPWVAIGNDYTDFVRTGAIEATMGRAVSVESDPETGLATVNIKRADGSMQSLKQITTIVMATGFTPFESLSFLPEDVLTKLEYTSEDPFLPIILDKGGTIRSEVPDLGFCGFYRGPYWGAMEMQARFLGDVWSKDKLRPLNSGYQIKVLRTLRDPALIHSRSQFPMGDYVGLMETFAKDLGIVRTELPGSNRSGPVIPARYHTIGKSYSTSSTSSTMELEVERTLNALKAMSHPDHGALKAARASAVFRALQGTWQSFKVLAKGRKDRSGSIHFAPRFPSSPGYEREYVCEQQLGPQGKGPSYVYRLAIGSGGNSPHIEVWSTDTARGFLARDLDHIIDLGCLRFQEDDGKRVAGKYVIPANVSP
ncbi:FAD-dependent pyridine nucleotide-disulfide oxidoreductase [Penicillium chermesinum]|uniref:FAD-dependent pyridine nucleotide-disulfide oxidoreductase n=1 Tax=Penicillium chermesinum TaxID=63820 RepID=A0A9W9TXM9_9EURO|nr:FAD-dependent pyridine nucleotide-disulfide oxidoreductase [Penicillium chermesinum]KAJ5247465.1 FAD-dependent pyridine nucleotide-disulfide oxidoreductase [Penicillium chermesinum]